LLLLSVRGGGEFRSLGEEKGTIGREEREIAIGDSKKRKRREIKRKLMRN
jgi:hypothetical protein